MSFTTAHLESQGATSRATLLFIHAHPDDETLATGLTMASYASRGHDVHLLTCTLGEEGEVIPAALAHLGASRDDSLGPWRREELRAAMAVLGVSHTVLGEDPLQGVLSRYRDSGMAGTQSAEHPQAFARADPAQAASLVAAHIRAVRPDVVVTYDEHGGYSHPDHIQTHRVTMMALSALAAEASGEGDRLAEAVPVPLVFCILTPQSWATQDRQWLRDNVAAGASSLVVPSHDEPYPRSVVRDEMVTHVVQEPTFVDVQTRALAHHATQVSVFQGYYALSNHVAIRLSGREGFALFDPVAGHLVPTVNGAPRCDGLLPCSQGHP